MTTASPAALDDMHRQVQALAREFAEGEVAPHAERWNAEHHVPVEIVRPLAETGLLGVIIPEEHGGPGMDATSLCLVVEELARVDAGTSVLVAVQNGLGASPIMRAAVQACMSSALMRREFSLKKRFCIWTAPHWSCDASQLRGTRPAEPATGRGSQVR